MPESGLYLHEELLLLALLDEKGVTASGAWYQQAIAGALMAELAMSGRVVVEGEGRAQRVLAVGEDLPGEPLLDRCLTEIHEARKPASLQTWVSRFAAIRGLKHLVAGPLVTRGILDVDEDTVLFVFRRTRYPEADGAAEDAVWKRLDHAIFSDSDGVDPRTAVLLSLADSANLLRLAFGRKDLKARKERIAQVVNGEKTGAAAREVIQAAQTAVLVAAIIPAIVATTVVSS